MLTHERENEPEALRLERAAVHELRRSIAILKRALEIETADKRTAQNEMVHLRRELFKLRGGAASHGTPPGAACIG